MIGLRPESEQPHLNLDEFEQDAIFVSATSSVLSIAMGVIPEMVIRNMRRLIGK